MMQSNDTQSGNWWEDRSDPQQTRFEMEFNRAIRQAFFAMVWRRIGAGGVAIALACAATVYLARSI
ncbi:MAG: hypothetical protein KKC85_10715 [Gammaproteobacteria bacterium]|nr:hypothetical protein [Gammaproteobacteria bacterium]